MSARVIGCTLSTIRKSRPKAAFQFVEHRTKFRFLRCVQQAFNTDFCPTVSRFDSKTCLPHSSTVKARQTSSFWPLSITLVLLCGALALGGSFASSWPIGRLKAVETQNDVLTDRLKDPLVLQIMTEPLPTGHAGNLTAEEEAKLKEFWGALFKLFGMTDLPEERISNLHTSHSETSLSDSKKPKRKLGFFSKKDASGTPNSEQNGAKASDADDKYGQTKAFYDALSTQTPEELRIAFWSMTKQDHPDALLLRFLRARKWDVNRALVMLISALYWRAQTMHLDDKIMKDGDAGALEGTTSADPTVKKESEDFLSLLRLGESFMHGKDKTGRPVCYVRVRLHKAGTYCESALEKYTVYLIETSRLLLEKPAETADYAPVKFMIKCFEANYPESLGVILVHKAPWIFSSIWSVIKGWLDPVVAAKVHFTKTPEDLEAYVSRNQLIKELGGDNPYEYKYIEPVAGENANQKDTKAMENLINKRLHYASEFQLATKLWITANSTSATSQTAELMSKRNELASRLHDNYWQLDPFVRARCLYDRLGAISPSPARKGIPSRTASVRTTLSEKCSFEIVTTTQILVNVNGDEID
ncbi:phosphatidylinositol transfer protein csr1 [Emydomyces testavorans]|uniref:Phosphatidylinositol transfer protein csr1 n=1 Tax=Emydomyces testavorans TaxID=2070801 RepID=A0AAF0ILE1_9EURO|nr:phosphatidylinositol transfer protein csr1 [Emydomyces testavorans]